MDGSPGREHEPNFTMPNRDIIREDNWEEYADQGFIARWGVWATDRELLSALMAAESRHGAQNVFTGEAFDLDEGRPLRNQPGKSVYIHPDAPGGGMALDWQLPSRRHRPRQDRG